jgi:hypothetical protein
VLGNSFLRDTSSNAGFWEPNYDAPHRALDLPANASEPKTYAPMTWTKAWSPHHDISTMKGKEVIVLSSIHSFLSTFLSLH